MIDNYGLFSHISNNITIDKSHNIYIKLDTDKDKSRLKESIRNIKKRNT